VTDVKHQAQPGRRAEVEQCTAQRKAREWPLLTARRGCSNASSYNLMVGADTFGDLLPDCGKLVIRNARVRR